MQCPRAVHACGALRLVGECTRHHNNVGGVTESQVRHNSSNVGGVTAGQVGHNSSHYNDAMMDEIDGYSPQSFHLHALLIQEAKTLHNTNHTCQI